MAKKLNVEDRILHTVKLPPRSRQSDGRGDEGVRLRHRDLQDHVTASQGKFEVRIDGELVFSKLETGRFPSNEEIKEAIKARLPEEATPFLFRS